MWQFCNQRFKGTLTQCTWEQHHRLNEIRYSKIITDSADKESLPSSCRQEITRAKEGAKVKQTVNKSCITSIPILEPCLRNKVRQHCNSKSVMISQQHLGSMKETKSLSLSSHSALAPNGTKDTQGKNVSSSIFETLQTQVIRQIWALRSFLSTSISTISLQFQDEPKSQSSLVSSSKNLAIIELQILQSFQVEPSLSQSHFKIICRFKNSEMERCEKSRTGRTTIRSVMILPVIQNFIAILNSACLVLSKSHNKQLNDDHPWRFFCSFLSLKFGNWGSNKE
jgi:hypothetical protein